MYFLALSQAPPPVVIEIATNRPVTIVPINRPPSACAPAAGPPSHLNPNMTTTGTSTGSKDGMILYLIADSVSISTAFSYCGLRSEERRVGKGCGSTCRSRWLPITLQNNNLTFD